MLTTKSPLSTPAWTKLLALSDEIKNRQIKDLFADDAQRAKDFTLIAEDILLDYSKNLISREVLKTLFQLAEQMDLFGAILAMYNGQPINQTENRAVLHIALRQQDDRPIMVDGHNVLPEVRKVLAQIQKFSNQVSSGQYLGMKGTPITDIVNIGIGGSDLGPVMVCQALDFYKTGKTNVHFVSNVDPAHLASTLAKLKPETTLFLIASKTFTTQETMANAQGAKKWFLQSGASQKDIAKHFVALSTNIPLATEFGISPDNIFPFWDFVGGRYSLCSAIGLSIACFVGYENFNQLLKGFDAVDNHFRKTPFEKNLPVILALVGIWSGNFRGAQNEAILPYDQYLSRFPAYFQQGNMESNGKSVDRSGKIVNYQTGPLIWGEPGTNGQHAFYQLIHQGTISVPCDFLAPIDPLWDNPEQHKMLLSNFFAQTEALMSGKSRTEVVAELQKAGKSSQEIEFLAPFKVFDGNKPTNSILYPKLNPYTLGKLIAIYEHKIFTQGVIWNVFSYDQWGVELGKQLANRILPELNGQPAIVKHDPSTASLIQYYLEHRSRE